MKNYQIIMSTLIAVLLMSAIFLGIQDHTISDMTVKFDAQNRVFLFEMKRENNFAQLN
jgi:hypothetical protein